MLQFGRLLSFPLSFKNLNEKLNKINISDIKAIKLKDKIQILTTANDHNVEINIIGDTINIKNPVKIYCDCDFFKYNLAYTLYKNNALLYPERFMLRPPRVKNLNMQLSGCKHIILTCQSLWTNKNVLIDIIE